MYQVNNFHWGLLTFLKLLLVFLFKLDSNRTPKNSLSSHFLDPSCGLLYSLTSWCGGLTRWGVYFLSANKTISEQVDEREGTVSLWHFIWWITAAVIHQNSRNFVLLEPKREFQFHSFQFDKESFFFESFQGNLHISERKSAVKIYLNAAFLLMNASVQNIIIPYLIKILGKYRFWFWKLLNDRNSHCLNVHLVFWEIILASCRIRICI